MTNTMRDYYQNTTLSMDTGMAAGPFGSPDRWTVPSSIAGNWERTIAISRTIVSYVLVAREYLPAAVGGVLWLSFHGAHTSFYTPFPVGMAVVNASLPEGH